MTQKSLETLPIDIHYNKLADWLVNRRHCGQQSQVLLTVIRDKVDQARKGTKANGHLDKDAQYLLDAPELNYYQVKELFELLKKTDLGKKNLLGQFTHPSMKIWAEVVRLYEKEGTYLAEAAQKIIRNVNYEVPAIKKQISKCQQTQKDCLRKENEQASTAADLRRQYGASCKQLGIEGEKIKTELAELVKDLPSELSRFAESAKSLDDAVQFYDRFTEFITGSKSMAAENVALLKHLLSKGNTTTFEWRTGRVPSWVEEQTIAIDLSDEQDTVANSAEDGIDWGAADPGGDVDVSDSIDFDIGDITVESGGVLVEEGEAPLENPDIDAIDWGPAVEVVPTCSDPSDTDAARGRDALSIIDNPDTRNIFIDNLLELQAFLGQRASELSHEGADSGHMASAPSDIHIDLNKVTTSLDKVKVILDKLTSVQMQHLMLIRDSPRYVDRLRDSLRQKLVLAEKLALAEKEMAGLRQEAREEEVVLGPQLDLLRKQTLVLKKQLEEEISRKYNDRKVNVIGEINTL